MKKSITLLIFLGLVGCDRAAMVLGDPLEEALAVYSSRDYETTATEFHVPCLGKVTAAFYVKVQTFLENLILIRKMMDDRGIVPFSEFCIAFEGSELTILATKVVDTEERYSGFYLPTPIPRITIAMNGRALAHELLHGWDVKHMAIGTINHDHWKTNGYNDLDDEYHKKAATIYPYWALVDWNPLN